MVAMETIHLIGSIDRNLSAYEKIRFAEIHHARDIIYVVGSVVLLLFGIPGNIMTMVVLTTKDLKDTVFSIYLSSLCFFNSISLAWCVPRFIFTVTSEREVYFQNKIFCGFYRICCFCFVVVSNWHLVLMSGARLSYIFDSQRKFAPLYEQPLKMLCSLVLSVFAIHVPLVWLWVSYEDDDGNEIECHLPSDSVIVLLVISLETIVSAAFLVVFNIILLKMNTKNEQEKYDDPVAYKMRKQLLLLSTISCVQYLISLLPICVLMPNIKRLFNMHTTIGREQAALGHGIIVLIAYTNNGSSFIVYCFFGRKFRQAFYKLLRQWKVVPKGFGKRAKKKESQMIDAISLTDFFNDELGVEPQELRKRAESIRSARLNFDELRADTNIVEAITHSFHKDQQQHKLSLS